jgi:hypothetical protein
MAFANSEARPNEPGRLGLIEKRANNTINAALPKAETNELLKELAEGEELGSNDLLICRALTWCRERS